MWTERAAVFWLGGRLSAADSMRRRLITHCNLVPLVRGLKDRVAVRLKGCRSTHLGVTP